MARQQIVIVGQSAALLLPQEILEQINVHVGDEVELSVVDHILVLQAIEAEQRQHKLEIVIDKVFKRRKGAYQQLAQG